MKVVFIINPIAGRKRWPVEEIIRTTAGADCTIRTWSSIAEIGDLVASLEDDVEVVAAVGGDGTVHEIGKRLVGRSQALAVIPTGSGNGLARHLGISLNPRTAIQEIHESRIEKVDVGRIDNGFFLGVCGVGFDAVVAHRFAEAGSRGIQTYIRQGFLTYTSYKAEHYEITLDDERLETKAFLVAVANSGQYGNDARIAPLASLQDGLLDVAIVRTGAIVKAPFLIYRLFTGALRDSKEIVLRKARKVRIERDDAGPGHVDGEPVMLPASFDCSLDERALNVCIPKSTTRF